MTSMFGIGSMSVTKRFGAHAWSAPRNIFSKSRWSCWYVCANLGPCQWVGQSSSVKLSYYNYTFFQLAASQALDVQQAKLHMLARKRDCSCTHHLGAETSQAFLAAAKLRPHTTTTYVTPSDCTQRARVPRTRCGSMKWISFCCTALILGIRTSTTNEVDRGSARRQPCLRAQRCTPLSTCSLLCPIAASRCNSNGRFCLKRVERAYSRT